MGFFSQPECDHTEDQGASWNFGGTVCVDTITESDGTTYYGYGNTADEAYANSHDAHDRDR